MLNSQYRYVKEHTVRELLSSFGWIHRSSPFSNVANFTPKKAKCLIHKLNSQTSNGFDQQEAVHSELLQTVNHIHLFQKEKQRHFLSLSLYLLLILLLLPLALQTTVGFGLSNNVFPFFSYLPPTPSIFSLPALEDLFLLPLPIFSWVFPFFLSLPVLEWRSFWASYPPPFSLGDITSLSFALLSTLYIFSFAHLFQFSIPPTFPFPVYLNNDIHFTILLS